MRRFTYRAALGVAFAALLGLALSLPLQAHEFGGQTHRHVSPGGKTGLGGLTVGLTGKRYKPAIWVDPDGCEHWVMDDGAEGYMTPHLQRNGRPVCRTQRTCGTMNTTQYFVDNGGTLSTEGVTRLRKFFRDTPAKAYVIVSHTDAAGSDAANMRLSEKQANAVANVGLQAGANIQQIRALGNRQPPATRLTATGRSQNKRLDVICIN